MIVGIEIDGVIIAFDGCGHLAEFDFGEGTIVIEEVIFLVDENSFIVHFDGLLELFLAQADIPIVPQENFIVWL